MGEAFITSLRQSVFMRRMKPGSIRSWVEYENLSPQRYSLFIIHREENSQNSLFLNWQKYLYSESRGGWGGGIRTNHLWKMPLLIFTDSPQGRYIPILFCQYQCGHLDLQIHHEDHMRGPALNLIKFHWVGTKCKVEESWCGSKGLYPQTCQSSLGKNNVLHNFLSSGFVSEEFCRLFEVS